MTKKGKFTPIGDIVRHVVAKSVLTDVSEDWEVLELSPPEWSGYISREQGVLSLVHNTSQTKSETHFDANQTITEQIVFVLDRDGQACEDGHWIRVHGLKAEQVLRMHLREQAEK